MASPRNAESPSCLTLQLPASHLPGSAAFALSTPISGPRPVRRRARSRHLCAPSLRRTAFTPGAFPLRFRGACLCTPEPPPCQTPRAHESDSSTPPREDADEMNEWVAALEGLFLEALKTYYQGTPMFTDSEFQTLREELEHLGAAQIRLDAMEKIWVQATSARDFDRRVREEFQMSEDDLNDLKSRLLLSGNVKRPTATVDRGRTTNAKRIALPEARKYLKDAQKIDAGERVDERLKWLLFSDATEERLKIMLLYLPAVLMSFVTASVLTILFALLDGEMKISVTAAGRVRLGILSYVVVMLTFWFSNQVTPVMLDYLDLGQPSLLRGECPICGAPVSCLFTGAARNRDERKCQVCGSVVGFNRRWSKVYLVSPPGTRKPQGPD